MFLHNTWDQVWGPPRVNSRSSPETLDAASATTATLMTHSCASSCLLTHSVNRLLFSGMSIIKSSQPDMLTFMEAS